MFFLSSRRRHTRCALVTGVQTCASDLAVDLRDYAEGAVRRIIAECGYLRDPIMRGAIFADCAFLWSELRQLIELDHRDRIALELGRREGLNEGITVPCGRLGHSLGSCTFAGLRTPRCAALMLGPAQMFGVFAFQRSEEHTS